MLQLVICHCKYGNKRQFAPAPAEKFLILVAVNNLYFIDRIASCKALAMTFTVI